MLLASRATRRDWTISETMLPHFVKHLLVLLQTISERLDVSRSSALDTVGSLRVIEGAPLDLTILVGFRKIHVEGPPALDCKLVGHVDHVTTEGWVPVTLDADASTKVSHVRIGNTVTDKLESVSVVMTPETALDDILVTLHCSQEGLHILRTE